MSIKTTCTPKPELSINDLLSTWPTLVFAGGQDFASIHWWITRWVAGVTFQFNPIFFYIIKKSQGDTSVLKQKQVETQIVDLTRVNKLV